MARAIYGGRWKNLGQLATGGQAEVFKVIDLQGEHAGELVLKRVRNPKRHDRFRNEVEAIARLDHPNVVKLLDHSALVADNALPERQYIVMPLAAQGDLSRRLDLYKNNVDSVLIVTKALVSALDAAHASNIIHRDVKPENILFPAVGHEVWLADFGICLLREGVRVTSIEEVVGPVQFMAPELEAGGQLDVGPEADVYSLGKVIYYMLSGGIVLPRERLHEPDYAGVFEGGDRQAMLGSLLSRMICPRERRISTMGDVAGHLERIESWARDAHLSAMNATTLSRLEGLKRTALEVDRRKGANDDVRARRAKALATAANGALAWFRAEFYKLSNEMRDGASISAGIRDVGPDVNDSPPVGDYRPRSGVELWVRNKHETFQREHVLRLSVGESRKITFTTRTASGRLSSMELPPEEAETADLRLIPAYAQRLDGRRPDPVDWQLFTPRGVLHKPPNPRQPFSLPALSRSAAPQQPVQVIAMTIGTDQWPEAADGFPGMLEKVLETFIGCLEAGPQW